MSSSSALATVDRLSALLNRFRVRAHWFHAGPLCGITVFDAQPGRAFLHVLRAGELDVSHAEAVPGLPVQLRVLEPSVLLYPRATHHVFHNPPKDGADFTCATLDFDGGERNPLVAALPPLLVVPLSQVPGLRDALDLLFAEADQLRCGSRLLADRLFEVVLIQLLRWVIDHPREVGIQAGLIMGLADARLARALVALHGDPGAPWTLASLARAAGMSRTAFATGFKSATGFTPSDYVANWRMALACSGLRAGQSVKSLAADLGYGAAAALSKAFKQRMGMSPKVWLLMQND